MIKGERVLVFASDSDVGLVGCGGFLAAKQASNASIRVVVVGEDSKRQQPESQRQKGKGLELLHIHDVLFWHYPHCAIPLSGTIVDAYLRTVLDFAPDLILLPATGESHVNQRRLTRGVINALEKQWAGNLCFYETTQPMPVVNTFIDISTTLDRKLQAISGLSSKQIPFDYIEHCRSLARVRGVASGKQYSEAFLVFPWDGTKQNFFETQPLISVVIRADDELILVHALNSLIQQHYHFLEVVLVWFGENKPDLTRFEVLAIRIISGQQNRSYNLNIGIAEARGEYIAFLDQDDVVYPMHLALLLAEMQGRPEVDVAHSGCRVVSCRRDGDSVVTGSEVEVINQAIDISRLLLGNSFPNHSLLFKSHIFRTLHFDESLEVYEGWEFLTQLFFSGYHFSHVNEVTCEYRLYCDEHSLTLPQDHARKSYLGLEKPVYDRIASRLKASHLQDLTSQFIQLEDNERALTESLNETKHKIAALQSQVDEKTAWLEVLKLALPLLGVDTLGRRGLMDLIGRSLPNEILFSLIVPVHNTDPHILRETLTSIIEQSYPGWDLCLVDDASTHTATLDVLNEFKPLLQSGGRLRFMRRSKRGGIVAASNDALSLAKAPFVAFVDHDDLLRDDALLEIALLLKHNAHYKLIYTDSTMIDLAGRLLHINHKPDWSPETLCHFNFINHLTVIRRDLVTGLDCNYEGSQDWDLLFRAEEQLKSSEIGHIKKPLYAWRATKQSLAYRSSAKPEAFSAGLDSAIAHLERKGLKQVQCRANPNGPGVICDWKATERRVEIIIATHNNFSGLKNCINGVLQGTDYPFIKISVIANRCEDTAMITYLNDLSNASQINLIVDDRQFNWAALNNLAANQSDADLLLFMNDDVEIQNRDWLHTMNRYFELEGIGIVGATLYFPNGALQHNGIHTDPLSVAHNIVSFGAFGELAVTRNVAAVTGACLLVSRQVFNVVGGFDERFAVNYNDVDFCLSVRHNGYRIIQANKAALVHHESFSRGKIDSLEKRMQLTEETKLMREKWGEFLFDPHWAEYEVYAQKTRILHVD